MDQRRDTDLFMITGSTQTRERTNKPTWNASHRPKPTKEVSTAYYRAKSIDNMMSWYEKREQWCMDAHARGYGATFRPLNPRSTFRFFQLKARYAKCTFFAALPQVRRSESAALTRLCFSFPLSGAFYPAGSSDLFITVISLLSWRRNRIPWTTWWREPQTNWNCETEIILSFATLARKNRRGQSDIWAVCDWWYLTSWSIQL